MTFRGNNTLRFRALLLGLVPAAVLAIALTSYLINVQLGDLREGFNEKGKAIAKEAAAISVYGLFTQDQKTLELSLRPVLLRAGWHQNGRIRP